MSFNNGPCNFQSLIHHLMLKLGVIAWLTSAVTKPDHKKHVLKLWNQLSKHSFRLWCHHFRGASMGMLVDNGQFQEFTTSSDVYTFVCPSLFLWGNGCLVETESFFELISSCWTSWLPPPLIWKPASRNMFCLSEIRFWRVNRFAATQSQKGRKARWECWSEGWF